ncbi:MAG: LacI family transcriptional regulator [Anaerolineaceae bacterium]|nr:LacI family transcriptional regulator [Anaerolineaceae bacterium]
MVTIREVAKKADVSTATVSHVINNTRLVNADTRQRVMLAMEETGYSPNYLAQSLRRGKTYTIGLVLPNLIDMSAAELGRAIEAAAFEKGYSVILGITDRNPSKELACIEILRNKHVDGLIVACPGWNDPDVVNMLQNRNPPVVLVDREFVNFDGGVVTSQNRQGSFNATQHLIGLGHRRIACLTGPSQMFDQLGNQREKGYRIALQEANIPVDENLIIEGDFRPETGRWAIQSLLALSEPPTAIFVCNDMMAFGVLKGAAESGYFVPTDLAVVSFDDIELAPYMTPSLTSVSIPRVDMALIAVQLLIDHLESKADINQKIYLPTDLIIRDSCGGLQVNGDVAAGRTTKT